MYMYNKQKLAYFEVIWRSPWHKINVNYAGYNEILRLKYIFVVFSFVGPVAIVIIGIVKAVVFISEGGSHYLKDRMANK